MMLYIISTYLILSHLLLVNSLLTGWSFSFDYRFLEARDPSLYAVAQRLAYDNHSVVSADRTPWLTRQTRYIWGPGQITEKEHIPYSEDLKCSHI